MDKIIGIGNALVDVLAHLESDEQLAEMSLPKGGMTLIDEDRLAQVQHTLASMKCERATGGSASNTIHALAELGNATGFIGSVSDDEMGHFYATQMKRRGIDAHLRTVAGGRTGIATTFITPDCERTFATHLGVSAQIDLVELPAMLANAGKGGIMHIEGYLVQNHEFIERALVMAREAGVRVSYDLASWNIVRADRDFVTHLVREYVDIAFANQEEAEAFSGQKDPEVALRQLAELTEMSVVKVGKRGALGMKHGGEPVFVATQHRKCVVDTTAAGDFFAAGFLHGLIHGEELQRCVDFGNRLAGEVIQVLGTQVEAEKLRRAVTD